MHDVVFAIKQRNMDELEKIFYAVSDPRNPKYGKHLTYDQVRTGSASRRQTHNLCIMQVTNLTSNMEATVQVQQWLEHNGATIVHTTKRGDYIKARASINTWEHLLSTTFFQFSHKTQGRILRAKVYSLPINVATLVSGAHYTVQLPPRFAARLMRAKVGTASSEMTPLLLNSYYNIYTNDGQGLGSQSLLEGLDQYYSPDDLSQFQELYDIPEDEVDEVIDGHESDRKCNINANNCAEANLGKTSCS
jgi:tripeptidyl-peptidase-1